MIAFIPFHKGYFQLPINKVIPEFEKELDNDANTLLNNVAYYDQSYTSNYQQSTNTVKNVDSTVLYSIFSFLFIFLVFPLRYMLYILDYLLNLG
ncbi:hypothetical protein [Flammeovirga pacifica]|nr:hypothetical protein [Flammeovirga pacifica]